MSKKHMSLLLYNLAQIYLKVHLRCSCTVTVLSQQGDLNNLEDHFEDSNYVQTMSMTEAQVLHLRKLINLLLINNLFYREMNLIKCIISLLMIRP